MTVLIAVAVGAFVLGCLATWGVLEEEECHRKYDEGYREGTLYTKDEYWRGVEDERQRIIDAVPTALARSVVARTIEPPERPL